MKSDKELFEEWFQSYFPVHMHSEANSLCMRYTKAAYLHAIAKGREMEREAAAKVAEKHSIGYDEFSEPWEITQSRCCTEIATAIRSREGKK